MSERIIYLNGNFVPESEAKVSIFDAGFRAGDGVYEATRTFNHKLFRLREHLNRLYGSLRYVRIDCGLKMEEMEQLSLEVLERNKGLLGEGDDYALWHVISRGLTGPIAGERRATVTIYCIPVEFKTFARGYIEGLKLVTPSTRRTPPQCLEAKAKITNKMNHIVATHEARQVAPDCMPLMLDIDGNIAETHMANFFFISNGKLCTPSDRNVLGGITRAALLELATELNMMTSEGDFTPHDVYNAEEAFISGTSSSIVPVRSLNGVAIGDQIPGPQTFRLIQAWNRKVGLDIVEQGLNHLDAKLRDALLPRWHERLSGTTDRSATAA